MISPARLATLLVLLVGFPAVAQEQLPTAPIPRLPPVEVIGVAPLPAFGIPAESYPGNVQSITAEDFHGRNVDDLSDFLYRRLGSVNINSTQGNPWQNDVTYRGFLASPLIRGHRRHSRLEPDLRAEHAGRRAGRAHEERA